MQAIYTRFAYSDGCDNMENVLPRHGPGPKTKGDWTNKHGEPSLATNPGGSAVPVTLSAYMSSLRALCLSNTKYELKHLILEQTSVEREKTPVLHFERLKLLAEKGEEEAG